MRFGHVVMAYFVIGAVLWGGGAIAWNDSGVTHLVVTGADNSTNISTNDQTKDELESSGGPIQEAASSIGGGALIAIWKLITGLLGFMFWPVATLINTNAPPTVVVLLGGVPTLAFYLGVMNVFMRSG